MGGKTLAKAAAPGYTKPGTRPIAEEPTIVVEAAPDAAAPTADGSSAAEAAPAEPAPVAESATTEAAPAAEEA